MDYKWIGGFTDITIVFIPARGVAGQVMVCLRFSTTPAGKEE